MDKSKKKTEWKKIRVGIRDSFIATSLLLRNAPKFPSTYTLRARKFKKVQPKNS